MDETGRSEMKLKSGMQAAAEHTIALLLSVARNVPSSCASLKAEKWERSKFVGVELKNKILGTIGLGKGSSGQPHSPC